MTDPGDQVYRDFLAELDGLERFRQRFQGRHTKAPLDREDPDLRRLVEALAYFSVQTRKATLANVRSTWRRLFAGFFDFLLEPLPAVTMVQASPTEKMAEPVTVPRGTELRLSPIDGAPGTFRTERDVRLLPIFADTAQVLPRPPETARLILPFTARMPRKGEIGVLSFHVRHLDDYATSLSVFHELRKCLRQVSVVYDQTADDESAGESCEFAFGRAAFAPDDTASYAHPIQRVRASFQLPERELYLHVKVRPRAGAWTRFSLCLDLDDAWKAGRSDHPELLHLFAVPAVNLKAEAARTITADGTRTEFPIVAATGGEDASLHSITGVFLRTKSGMTPMRPGFLPGEGPSYEVDDALDADLRTRRTLVIRMPEAFAEPAKISVEALWYQPAFAARAIGRIAVALPFRHLEGVTWQTLGTLEPPQDSPLVDDVAALTQILAWKVKPTLSRDELIALLAHLGSPAKSPLARAMRWLRDLTVRVAPDSALRGSGLRHVYEATLEPFDPAFEPLAVAFLLAVADLLDAWDAEAMVELRATVAGLGPLSLPTAP